MKFLIAIPLVFSIIAFILSLLSLLAGYKVGFMDEYNVLTLNTSALGQQAIQNIANGQSPTATSTSGSGGAIGSIIASATALLPSSAASEAASILGSVGSSVADDLATQLGISEFYSIHAMDFCQGDFSPTATTAGASHNVTSCTKPLDFQAYNFTEKINQELSVGPFQITLAELGVSQDIQDKLNDLPKIAKALAAVFIVSCFLTGLSMLGSFGGFLLLPHKGRTISFFNFLLALLAVILLLASSLVATIAPPEVTKQLQENNIDAIGLEIIASKKLEALTWAAFALELVAMFYWFYELVVECVRRRRTGGFMEKRDVYGK
ncbi:hypothetical protein N0V82_008132 [Gnomoniopsis sp. IMI 355080]|nr:hypothetical protein N0V82_008132 [Gnomoniopsis sp. IMI 355080]